MRNSEKGISTQAGENQLHGVDFNDFIQQQKGSTSIELASEFGLTSRDVKKLKKQLERS